MIYFETGGKKYKVLTEEVVVPTPPVPPAPPTPTPTDKKLVILHCPAWPNSTVPGWGLDNLPLTSASVFTYFVLPVSASGALLGMNSAQETKFVTAVKAGGKKVTFSIAGGAQNPFDIKTAVTTNRVAFLNNIAAHITLHGYDGVMVDIENTSIAPTDMVSFLKDLRAKLPNSFIGLDTQPYQINTVWRDLGQVAHLIDACAPMLYDYSNTVNDILATLDPWAVKVGNKKVLMGSAVGYDATGFDLTEWPLALDIVKTKGYGGAGIWQKNIYSLEYQNILKNKFPIIS